MALSRRQEEDHSECVPRLSFALEEDRGDPILMDEFAREREAFGDLLNPTKVMAHCPPILKAAKALAASIQESAQLPKALLPLVYLRVAALTYASRAQIPTRLRASAR
jgi:hypothetical protein